MLYCHSLAIFIYYSDALIAFNDHFEILRKNMAIKPNSMKSVLIVHLFIRIPDGRSPDITTFANQ